MVMSGKSPTQATHPRVPQIGKTSTPTSGWLPGQAGQQFGPQHTTVLPSAFSQVGTRAGDTQDAARNDTGAQQKKKARNGGNACIHGGGVC